MEREKAKAFVDAIQVYLEKARFKVDVDLDNVNLTIAAVQDTRLDFSLGFVTRDGTLIPMDTHYSVMLKKSVVLRPGVLNRPVSEVALKRFWKQFLKLVPRQAQVSLTYPESLVDELDVADDDESYSTVYEVWSFKVTVAIGDQKNDCDTSLWFNNLIPERRFRAIWKRCVGPISEE